MTINSFECHRKAIDILEIYLYNVIYFHGNSERGDYV